MRLDPYSGNRQIMPNTIIKFFNLENKSIFGINYLRDLTAEFFDFCVKELNLKYENEFQYRNFFKKNYNNLNLIYEIM